MDNIIESHPPTKLTSASPEYYLRRVRQDAHIPVKNFPDDLSSPTTKKRKAIRKLFIGSGFQGDKESSSLNYSSRTQFGQQVLRYATPNNLLDDHQHAVPDDADNDYEVEGYASDNDKTSLYDSPQVDTDELTAEGYLFDSVSNKMLIHLGHHFKDVTQFRRAIEVFAIREGFKLCIMDNRCDFVSCECSALCCDWKISASIQPNGQKFQIIHLINDHNCNRYEPQFQPSSKWIAAMFLHKWKQQPHLKHADITKHIAAEYNVSCDPNKVFEAAKRAKALLGIDHADGYSDLYQYVEEMKKLHTRNVVILETVELKDVDEPTFKRLFVCFAEPAYAFKNECRRILFVDGWELRGPYRSVMLVAVAIDGNDGILPIAFCEVLNEDIDSWVFFFTNLTNALHMEYGEGLCILTDGENGLEYVFEEYLFRAVRRQCCQNIFTQMVKAFPDAPVQHLFWAACRSACNYRFNNYMNLIGDESQECHAWLMGTNWNQWALHSMPDWVKSNHVTLMITEQLRQFLKKYLDMSITHRFTGLTNTTAYLFERRRLQGWEWIRQRITPAVTKIIQQHAIEARWLIMQDDTATITGVQDSSSTIYEVDMQSQLCTCGLWQRSGVPCPHACKCILSKAENIEDFVDNFQTISQYRDIYGPGMNTLPKDFPWMSHVSTVLLPPPCAHTITVQHTSCHIAPAAQIQPSQYLASTPAAAHDFFRLQSSSSDDDSMSL